MNSEALPPQRLPHWKGRYLETVDGGLEYLLEAWGRTLHSGWKPRLGVAPNILARFIPRRDPPPPEIDEDVLDQVNIAVAALEHYSKSQYAAIVAEYCINAPIRTKLNALRKFDFDWSQPTYRRYRDLGLSFLKGRLGAL